MHIQRLIPKRALPLALAAMTSFGVARTSAATIQNQYMRRQEDRVELRALDNEYDDTSDSEKDSSQINNIICLAFVTLAIFGGAKLGDWLCNDKNKT